MNKLVKKYIYRTDLGYVKRNRKTKMAASLFDNMDAVATAATYELEEMYKVEHFDFVNSMEKAGVHLWMRKQELEMSIEAFLAYMKTYNTDVSFIQLQKSYYRVRTAFVYCHVERGRGTRGINVTVFASKSDIDNLFGKEEIASCIVNRGRIRWAFIAEDGGSDSTDMNIGDLTTPIFDCHYPNIKPSVDEYIKNYLDSPANVLLLVGTPGTGKTSFLRHMIAANKLTATVTYDEDLFQRDRFFMEFLQDRDSTVLVVEDADAIIKTREHHNNSIMSKLLNVSNGLVQFDKKIVLSTNISQMSTIDSALMRPGRCFDVLKFPSLSLKQANEVRTAHNLAPLTQDQEYTLAQVFMGNGVETERMGII